MDCIVFDYSGRFGHFLKAEANASAPSYGLPPRTALLGLVGAILGLPKDRSQVLLKSAEFTVSGSAERTHWHIANLRKDPPAPLTFEIRRTAKGSSKEQRNTRVAQEWLIRPEFRVWAMLPEDYRDEFATRVRERRWHFTPCLGLSEMFADLVFVDRRPVESLTGGVYPVSGVMRRDQVELDLGEACRRGLAIQAFRMPRDVTEGRAFTHEAYYREMHDQPVPVHTESAVRVGQRIIMWM